VSGYAVYQALSFTHSLILSRISPTLIAEAVRNHLLKRFMTSHPTLLGVAIGLLLVVSIIVMETWFPRVGEAWKRHNRLVQSVWFTIGFFGVWVIRFWQWRRRFFFWTSVCAFFLVHTLGVLYYSTQIRPLVLREWVVLLLAESFVFAFYMTWSIRRFGHSVRHKAAT